MLNWTELAEKLPAHVRVMQLAINYYSSDSRALGVFLKGSFARGDYDWFSDIDLHVLVAAEEFDALVAERPGAMQQWGRLLVQRSTTGVHQLVGLYDTGVELEIDFHRPDYLKRPRFGMDMLILHDPHGLLAPFVVECDMAVPTPEVDAVRLAELWQSVWGWLWSGVRKTLRGEVWEGMSYLEWLREQAVLPVYRTLHGQLPRGYRRIEQWADPDFLAKLAPTVAPAETLAVVGAMISLTELFTQQAAELAQLYEITLPLTPTGVCTLVEKALAEYHARS